MTRLSDEDVERIADALAKRVAPAVPTVVPQPIWIDPRGYYPWMQHPGYPTYYPFQVTCSTNTKTVLYN